ncbi:hypothetical protein KAI92_00515 [Candidatus Parcubacteria bacterium]|nr:hypothetical protein [Candidatus Parcubacteria bacterium]
MQEKRLLIIEDKPQHLADAKIAAQKAISAGLITDVDYASTFDEAMNCLKTKTYHGIVSDIFFPRDNEKEDGDKYITGWCSTFTSICHDELFPFLREPNSILDEKSFNYYRDWKEGKEMHPSGVVMVLEAHDRGIPIVLCTDTYHHGIKTQVIFAWNKTTIIDCYLDDDKLLHAEKKHWNRAIKSVLNTGVKKKYKRISYYIEVGEEAFVREERRKEIATILATSKTTN